jgi:hypothetical protein
MSAAKCGLMQCSKQPHHSSTSSANASGWRAMAPYPVWTGSRYRPKSQSFLIAQTPIRSVFTGLFSRRNLRVVPLMGDVRFTPQ